MHRAISRLSRRGLRTWWYGRSLTSLSWLCVYRLTADFPKSEVYTLTSQLRQAAISIPANIAEGFKKTGKQDKPRFYNIAQGSIEESRYYLIFAQDLGYGDTTELQSLLSEVSKLLAAYCKGLFNSNY
jgi:four helix bundle protein